MAGELAAALAAIAAECGTIKKTGDNSHQRYTYASDTDLKRHLQPLLGKHGVSIIPSEIDATWDTQGNRARCRMLVTYTIAHKSGENMTGQALGEGINNGDKAAYIAQTGAFKYLIRTVFAVPTSDDPERDEPIHNQPAPTAKKWTDKQRAAFCATVSEIGLDYESVAGWCESLGRPRPSVMAPAVRKKLLTALSSQTNRDKVAAFAGGAS